MPYISYLSTYCTGVLRSSTEIAAKAGTCGYIGDMYGLYRLHRELRSINDMPKLPTDTIRSGNAAKSLGVSSPTNQVTALLACDHFSIDKDNKSSFIGVFEGFVFKSLPAQVLRFFIVGNLRNVVGNSLRIVHEQPNGVTAEVAELQIDNSPASSVRFSLELGNLSLIDAGEHVFVVLVDDYRAGELRLPVALREG